MNYLSTSQTATMLGVTPHTLRCWRMQGGKYGLGFIKIGGRVRYAKDAVEAWLKQRTNPGEIK